jgi:hypothetical protein
MGLLNELDIAIQQGAATPEERLQRIAQHVAFARSHLRDLPMLWRAVDAAHRPERRERMLEPWTDDWYQLVDYAGQPLDDPFQIPYRVDEPPDDPADSAFIADLRRDGHATVGVYDEDSDSYRMVTVTFDEDAPRLTAESYQALVTAGQGRIGRHEPISYVQNDDDTFFPVLSHPDERPFTLEEDAEMERLWRAERGQP